MFCSDGVLCGVDLAFCHVKLESFRSLCLVMLSFGHVVFCLVMLACALRGVFIM